MTEKSTAKTKKKKDPFLGKTLEGKYKIETKLGGGGMGAVYKGTHLLMKRTVAVKVLHPALAGLPGDDEFLRRFQREARTSSKIHHPNAIAIYDFGIEDETPYIVMEFNTGRSLKDILAKDGPLSIERTLNILQQVCSAVDEAHAHGIVHRDLKPDNIMISENRDGSDRAVVLDFGIAKILSDDANTDTQLTKAGGLVGTPQYMSPEQGLGQQCDARSDIYSLGIITYEMLTGDVPFQSDSMMQLVLKHMNEKPISAREFNKKAGIPEDVDAAVMKALEKKPDDRQATVMQFFQELSGGATLSLSPSSSQTREMPAAASGAGLNVPEMLKSPKFLGGFGAALALVLVLVFALSGSDTENNEAKISPAQQSDELTGLDAGTDVGVGSEIGQEISDEQRAQSKEHFDRAVELHRKKEYLAAQAEYERALELDPRNGKAYANLGDVFISSGALQEAVSALQKSVSVDPGDAMAFTNLGYALGELGKLDESLEAYKNTVALKPDYALGHNNLGFAYFKSGKLDEAAEAYKESIRLDPNYVRAYYNLADVYKAQNRWERVVTALKLAVRKDPQNPAAYNSLGEAHLKLGEQQEAIAAFGQALRIDKNFEPAQNNMQKLGRASLR